MAIFVEVQEHELDRFEQHFRLEVAGVFSMTDVVRAIVRVGLPSEVARDLSAEFVRILVERSQSGAL